MTAETTQQLPDGEVSSRDKTTRLFEAVERLLRPESLGNLSPYRSAMTNLDRFEAFKQLCKYRGRRYACCDFENFTCDTEQKRNTVDRLKKIALEFKSLCDNGNGGLVILGPPGTGKDHLLMAMMRSAIIHHGLKVKWFDGLRLFAEIKNAIGEGTVERLLSSLVGVQILAISDPVPPRDALSVYELSVLRDIVERRYNAQMATWITTNVQTAEDARRLFTDAVLSRLLDGATEVFCDWTSYRKPLER